MPAAPLPGRGSSGSTGAVASGAARVAGLVAGMARAEGRRFDLTAAAPEVLARVRTHLDLQAARDFYGGVLGCAEGRSTDTWVDFDFFGHQLSLHLGTPFTTTDTGRVGEHWVPMPHLGLVLALDKKPAVQRSL